MIIADKLCDIGAVYVELELPAGAAHDAASGSHSTVDWVLTQATIFALMSLETAFGRFSGKWKKLQVG